MLLAPLLQDLSYMRSPDYRGKNYSYTQKREDSGNQILFPSKEEDEDYL